MKPYGITIFCDDFRREVMGKTTLVGIYGPDLLLYADFPAAIPKLVIFAQLRFAPIDAPNVKIAVFVPWVKDKPILEAAVLEKQDVPPQPPPPTAEDKDITPLLAVNHPIIFSPFILHGEGMIKVRANINGEVVKVGSLRITKARDISQITRGGVIE